MTYWSQIRQFFEPRQLRQQVAQQLPGLEPDGWLTTLLAPLKRQFAEIFTLSLFVNLLALSVPVFSLQVYDRVISHNATSTLIALLCGVLIALGFDLILRQTRSRMLQHTARHMDARLGRAIYDKLASLPLLTLESRPAPHWQSLFQDIGMLRSVLAGPPAVLVTDLPFALLFLAVIFLIATPVAWVLLLAIPAFMALTFFSGRMIASGTARESGITRGRENLLSEMMQGRLAVRALRIDRAVQPEWEAHHAAVIGQSFLRGRQIDGAVAMGQTLAMSTSVMLITIGALAIIDRDMTMGALVATNMLASRIIGPMNQLLGSWKSFAACRESIRRLDGFFRLESERDVPVVARDTPRGALTLEEVSFAYDSGKPVLDGISLALSSGEVIGILGRNGSGKTTLLKLLQGLYTPTQGRVLLDGADLRQFSRRELADWIGYVPQECFLFSGSIRDNIAKAWPEASDEAILRAAELAGASDFIAALPDGYATEIGEAGHKLSGGQRQRLAIARALVKSPPILVFDEISSHLDTQAEAALAVTIRSLALRHTVILAAHSPALLKACHKLIVLERGRVLLAGPAEEVLRVLREPKAAESKIAG